jgi:tumor protein p53-inducible protein 3
MKAVIFDRPGGPEVLRVEEVSSFQTTTKIKKNEIKIRVMASGVNRADLLQRRGLYPSPVGESPILGLEVSGIVEEVGSEVKRFKPGDKVMSLLAGGGYASECIVPEGLVMPLPEGIDFVSGAAIPEAFITAHHNLFWLGKVAKGNSVLIHAGASGVGTAGIQLVISIGGMVWVTVGSDVKATFCSNLGARSINYKKFNFADVILPQKIQVVLDPVGPGYLDSNLKVLDFGGRLVLIGMMSGKQAPLDFSVVLTERIHLIGSMLRPLPLSEKTAAVARFVSDCLQKFELRVLTPIVDSVYPAERAAEAHSHMESNKNMGKIILTW